MSTLQAGLQWLGLVVWLAVCLIVVYSQYSGLRRPQEQAVGRTPRAVRAPWLMAIVLIPYLVLMVVLWRPIFPALAPATRLAAAVAGTAILVCGTALILWARATLGRSHNISSVSGVRLFADHRLVTQGPFAVVRHPMYLGFLVAALGSLLLYGTWTIVFVLLHGAVFIVRARREEEALAARFGEQWRDYCRQVPPVFPRL